jgi:hypothetical protein
MKNSTDVITFVPLLMASPVSRREIVNKIHTLYPDLILSWNPKTQVPELFNTHQKGDKEVHLKPLSYFKEKIMGELIVHTLFSEMEKFKTAAFAHDLLSLEKTLATVSRPFITHYNDYTPSRIFVSKETFSFLPSNLFHDEELHLGLTQIKDIPKRFKISGQPTDYILPFFIDTEEIKSGHKMLSIIKEVKQTTEKIMSIIGLDKHTFIETPSSLKYR